MDAMVPGKVGALRRTGRALDATRRFGLNVIFFGLLLGLVVAVGSGGKPRVPKGCAVVVKPAGSIVEQLDGNAVDRARAGLLGGGNDQTLLKDVVDAIDSAREDSRVKALVLDLSEMGPAGMTKLEDLKMAIGRFKQSGKKVIATSSLYDQYGYYLAAQADEVWLNPMGMVLLEGFSRFGTYYKEGLDKLEVEWHVFRVGEFKSAVEPYLRNDMSPEAKEANLAYLSDLWKSYLGDVAAARKTTPEKLTDFIERYPEHLKASAGDGARTALAAGLVDKVGPRDVLRKRVIALVGEDEDTHTFNQIAYKDYLKALDKDRFGEKAKGKLVAVVVAKGTILDGTQPPGQIGGDSTAALIGQARHDDDVKAIVLRVDSPGGSGSASEVIRRELELARADGKVVVVSMGSVAASGGYWISMAADEVLASPNTITGSIGIFGMFPTFQKPLAKYLGVHVDGVGTTSLAGALRPDRALDPRVAEVIQAMVDQGYQEFLRVVSTGRRMTPEAVDKVGRGHVWSGRRALELGLIDKLGGLDDAVKVAAGRAKLGEAYKVRFIEKELSWKQKLVRSVFAQASAGAAEEIRTSRTAAPYLVAARLWARQQAEIELAAGAQGVLAYGFVPVE